MDPQKSNRFSNSPANNSTVKKIRTKSRTIEILEVEDKAEEDSSIFPLSRIKRLLQVGTDEAIRSETLKIMSKAAELFLQDFTKKTYQFTKSKNKKTVVFADVLEAVANNDCLGFIKDSGILSCVESNLQAKIDVVQIQPVDDPELE